MPRNPWTAPTRTTRSIHIPVARAPQWLVPGEMVQSPETGLQYRTERLLGEGGFGQVYLARRLGRSATVAEIVCIKGRQRVDGWLREGYLRPPLGGPSRALPG